MSTLSDVLAEHSVLSGSAVAHLQAVVSEWQLLADLSFSDLLLWVPTDGQELVCAAQARPTTGVTAFVDDRVSAVIAFADFPLLRHAWEEERVMSEEPPVEALRREDMRRLRLGAHSSARVAGPERRRNLPSIVHPAGIASPSPTRSGRSA